MRAWPGLLGVWLTGDVLWEFVEGVRIPGRGAVRRAGSGPAGPPCTRTQSHTGAENPSAECRERPGSHLALALATSPSLSVLICELGTAWLPPPRPCPAPPVPWASWWRVVGLRSAFARCHCEADCPALSLQVTTMSVRVRFLSSGDAGTVGVMGRSASFAGFSSAQSRRIA